MPTYAEWRCPHREADDTPVHGSRWACDLHEQLLAGRRERAEARLPLES